MPYFKNMNTKTDSRESVFCFPWNYFRDTVPVYAAQPDDDPLCHPDRTRISWCNCCAKLWGISGFPQDHKSEKHI